MLLYYSSHLYTCYCQYNWSIHLLNYLHSKNCNSLPKKNIQFDKNLLLINLLKKQLPPLAVHRSIRLVFEEACSQGKSVQHEISTVFPCGAKVHRDVTSGDVQDREISRGRRMGRISSRAKNRGNGLKRLFEQRDDRARCLGASVLNDARPINPANVGD